MTPEASLLPTFKLDEKFLAGGGKLTLEVSAPGAPDLLAAIRSSSDPIPGGDFVLGSVKASAAVGDKVGFGGDAKGTVTFSGHADAAFGLGVYSDAAEAIRAAAPAAELAGGLGVERRDGTRFVALRAAYDIGAAAKGSVALGAGASITFGASATSAGGFAVLYRFADAQPAAEVFRNVFDGWRLPRQVAEAKDLAPGTWLMAEVDGSFGMKVGVQAGYDFSWIRQLPGGALKGDIGLRVQLGASAAVGFEASGKYAVVLARESDAEILRLRVYKMARRGWTFALDARVTITSQLPPAVSQSHKAEDLVAAIFGLNHNQVIETLRDSREFVSSTVSLRDKLAGVILHLGGGALESAGGMGEQQLRALFDAGQKKLAGFLGRFDEALKHGGHEVTSLLLSLSADELTGLEAVLRELVAAGSAPEAQQIVRRLAGSAGFERTPTGRFIEAAVGPPMAVLANAATAARLQSIAAGALAVLDGDVLRMLLDFLRREVSPGKAQAAASEADFARLDPLLKARLAAFLGKQQTVMADLVQVQAAIRSVFAHADKFEETALRLAKQKQEFAFAARYARTEGSTALLDLSIDTTRGDAAARDALRAAIDGDFNEILLQPHPAVTINGAELTHNIARNVSSELTLPFGAVSEVSALLSSASLTVEEDSGRVLLYKLEASSKDTERRSIFGARSGRDSTLTVAAMLPVGVGDGLKRWKDDTFQYSYRMERAALKMRASQFQEELAPLVARYVPAAFPDRSGAGFPEFVAELDRFLDGQDTDAGTRAIGDTLVTLSLSSPPAYLGAWAKAPARRKDPVYMDLSLALQARLKELVTFYYFSDPARYKDLASAAAPIVFSCLPVSTSIELNGGGEVERFNTDRDLHWDVADIREVRAMTGARQTADALSTRLTTISKILSGIPELAGTAQFYGLDQIGRIVAATASLPELLGSLLRLESLLVDKAVSTGLEIAAFRDAAAKNPADALKHLARFGEELADTFSHTLGSHPFLSGASRPLATLLFMEAAPVFDPAVTGAVSALLEITVIRSGKMSVEEMLGGELADRPELILYQQPFVQ